MINISEDLWWDTFEEYSIKFGEARPDYKKLKPEEAEIGALFNMELDMHNGGFLQFFCNWGYEAYIYALRGLESIGAIETKKLLEKQYGVIARLKDDKRVDELWAIPEFLKESELDKLDKLDEEYWEDKEKIMDKMYTHYIEKK